MKRALALNSVALFLALGCHSDQPRPTRTIALLDISGSIYPEEVDREFSEMQKLADNMHRGDELILIPITGNARNDTPGHIIRLVAPQSRAPFDSDLVAFRKNADAGITGMKGWAKRNPASHTDILGSLEVATQEIDQTHAVITKLIIMSDFLEDENQYNFARDRSLGYVPETRALANRQAGHGFIDYICGESVHLARLRSRDRTATSTTRLTAVDTFWNDLLQQDTCPSLSLVQHF